MLPRAAPMKTKDKRQKRGSIETTSYGLAKESYGSLNLLVPDFSIEENKLIIKTRPPTLNDYPAHSDRIIISDLKEANINKSENYHVCIVNLSKIDDRRPARHAAEKERLEEVRKKEEEDEKEVVDDLEWNYYSLELYGARGGSSGNSGANKRRRRGANQSKIGRSDTDGKLFKINDDKYMRKDYRNKKSVEIATTVLQSYISSWLAKRQLKKLKKRDTKREKICLELLTTEKTYLTNLKIIEEVFQKPLRELCNKKGSGIKLVDYNTIFHPSLANIMNLNTIFCNDLEKCIFLENKPGKPKEFNRYAKTSELILRITPYMKMYGSYCSNFENSTKTIKKLEKNSKISDVIEKITYDERTNKLGLNSYLSLPIQRVPRYRLLLKELLKNSEKEHPDYEGIKNAINAISDIANYLDIAVENVKFSQELIEIKDKFLPTDHIDIPQPHRKFIKKFTVREGVVKSGQMGQHQKLVCHLFNDLILFSYKKQFDKFQYVNHIDLESCVLYDSPPRFVKITGTNRQVMLTCKTEKDKFEFLKSIAEQISLLKKRRRVSVKKEAFTDFYRSTTGVASQVIFSYSDFECVEYIKQVKCRMIKYGSRPSVKFLSLSEDEKKLIIEDEKKKNYEMIDLGGRNITELVKGQKTQVFRKKLLEDLDGLSFSLLLAGGNSNNRKSLDLICENKLEFLIWTKALKFILFDQGKTKGVVTDDFRKETKLPSGDVYIWGKDAGILAHVRGKDLNVPRVMRQFLCLPVFTVACKDSSVFIVLENGKVFSFGEGENGELGHGDCLNYTSPCLVASIEDYKIIQVSMGERHTLLLGMNGNVFSCGGGSFGQLGLGEKIKKQSKPVLISQIAAKQVVMINAGANHSSALTIDGELFIWGCAKNGQLGFGDLKNEYVPKLLTLQRDTIYKRIIGKQKEFIVQTSLGYMHSMVLSEDGHIHIWGSGDDGQLGKKVKKGERILTPEPLSFEGLGGSVKFISSGAFHCGAVTKHGRVYMWGSNIYGQLGLGKKQKLSYRPVLVKTIENVGNCVYLECGTNHTTAILERKFRKRVYAWGAGTYGRLGLGREQKEDDQVYPKIVKYLDDKNVIRIVSGGCLSVCICSHQSSVPKKEIKECMNEKCQRIFSGNRKKMNCKYCGGIFCSKCFRYKPAPPSTKVKTSSSSTNISISSSTSSKMKQRKIRFGLNLEPVLVCEDCFKIIKTMNM